MRIVYVLDHKFVRGPDGGWYATAAYPLRFIAEQLPDLKEFCIWGRLIESDSVKGLVRLDNMVPAGSVKITFAGPLARKTTPLNYLTKGFQMLPDLRRRVRQADVVWAVLPGVYPVLGWWFRQDRQLRITQQGGDPSQSIQLVYPRLGFVGGYLDKCCHKLAEQADIASYVSDKLRARYGGEARRTLVFNNSRLTSEMLWDRKGTAMHKPFRLLYIGRLSPEKGLFFLLEALRDLEDIELRVVGIGHAEEELKRLAAELGVDQKVTWLGRLQWGPELFSALREGDASILPSLTEGLPLALVDAMSQSLPVIGSNVGGIPEVIEDGLNGILIPPGSSKAIVEAVNRMRSKKLWTTLHRGAFETAKNHTIEKQLGKLLVMIRQWWESRRVM